MNNRRSKPGGLGPEYGGQFQDASVAKAYPTRPPYPSQVFDILLGLVRNQSPLILDLGCGTGDIGRPIAPHVSRIDAVDPSTAMIERGRALFGGDHPNLRWIVSTAEEFAYPGPYALVVAGESLHWMDWGVVMSQIRHSLTPEGRLAIVPGRSFRNEPWGTKVGQLMGRYSTNREFERYDLLHELAERKLFVPEQTKETQPVLFTQTIDEYVESFHSRNGLSRDRMGSSAEEFDAQLKAIIAGYQSNPVVEFELVAEVAWGIPT